MWSEASTDTQSAAHALTSQAHTYAAQSPLRRACHLRRRRGRATGIRCAVHCHPVTSILTKQRQSSRSRRGLAKKAAATALAAAVAAVVARAAPRAAGRATAGRRGLCLWHTVYGWLPWRERPQRHGGGTSRFTVSGTALARVLARAFGGVDSGGARPISENSAAPHHGRRRRTTCRGCAGTDATTRASRRLQ